MPTPDPPPLPAPLLASPDSAVALAATLEGGTESSADIVSVPVAQRLGRFVLLRELGAGGMGTVFAAYDEQLDRKVALKLLHTVGTTAAGRTRVLREAQAMARVSHPNVVHVYDVGELHGRVFIAMEYIEGVTLAAWQKTEAARHDWKSTLGRYQQAGAGLLAAHRTGLVHRDFKPDNVLVDGDARVRVADFGLACLNDSERAASAAGVAPVSADAQTPPGALRTPVSQEGAIAGTPGYMSPEQYRGAAVDGRSDQFSFCVALYEALYHQLPFPGTTVAELAANTIAGQLRAPPADSLVPADIRQAVLRGLSIEPEARFPSMAELLLAIELDERNPARGRALRRGISAIIVIGCGGLAALAGSSVLTPLAMVALSAAALTLISGIFVAFHRSLRENGFSRDLLALSMITIATLLGIRVLGVLLRLEVTQLIPIDLVGMAGFMASMAYRYLKDLWKVAAVLAVGAVVTYLWPQQAPKLMRFIYAVLPFAVVAAWMRTARQHGASSKPPKN